jgi:hypothetical protein
LVEQRTENPRVVGSIPTLATIHPVKHLRDSKSPARVRLKRAERAIDVPMSITALSGE